jgi:chorismate-pyruvate lyase
MPECTPAVDSATSPTGASGPCAVAYPLDEFYQRRGLHLPPLEVVEAASVPEPYHGLLVHERDMTSTLEAFHQDRVHLRLVSRQQQGDDYFREVVLVLDKNETPVEFGAIRISLPRFPAPARAAILEEHFPLGHILKEFSIEYVSRPKRFLRLASDKTINRLLGLNGVHYLFGRRNSLLDPAGNSLAEIVEILPPGTSSTGPTRPIKW